MGVNQLSSWRALERHAARLRDAGIDELFGADPDRLADLCLEGAGISIDLSKQRIDRAAVDGLVTLAAERDLGGAIDALFDGKCVNVTENRPALHTALRSTAAPGPSTAAAERAAEVEAVRTKIGLFADRVANGELRGYGGDRLRDVVNIGIGGSHLGPQLVCEALRYDCNPAVNMHFVSNVDGGDLDRVLTPLDPGTTLFLVASKSFTTAETLLNARSAARWIETRFKNPVATRSHFAAVTAKPAKAVEFGIDADSVFPMWDWVGGRYSLWSAIGLPIAIALGGDGFKRLLAGAEAMDKHFRNAEFARNIPVMSALIGIWNNNFLGYESLAIVPYDDRLQGLPEYHQHGEMESNGKLVTNADEVAQYPTAPTLWGGTGTNAQHAFFQLLHQGNRKIATDFILVLSHQRATREHHDMLVENCIAQAEALMRGRPKETFRDSAPANTGVDLPLHRESPGNRPTSMLTIEALTAETLGALLALYEHRTYVQGVIWDIDSFDQWGVELGKSLAVNILEELQTGEIGNHDPSTTSLLAQYRKLRDG